MKRDGPDGLAVEGEAFRVLSYEGAFLATDGPAAGVTAADAGSSEPGTTPAVQSVGLRGAA